MCGRLHTAHVFRSEYNMMHREMSKRSPLISKFIDVHTEVQPMHTARGNTPVNPAHSEDTIKRLRAQVGRSLGLTADESGAPAPPPPDGGIS